MGAIPPVFRCWKMLAKERNNNSGGTPMTSYTAQEEVSGGP